MKRMVPIEKTFDVIRRLPTGVEFNSIQEFVMQQPIPAPNTIFHWINPKIFFPMLAITSALGATLLFTQPFHHATSPVSQLQHENLPKAGSPLIQVDSSPNNLSLHIPALQDQKISPLLPPEIVSVPDPLPPVNGVQDRSALAFLPPPHIFPADSPARKKVIITSTNGKTVTVISSSGTTSSNSDVSIVTGSGTVSASSSVNGDSTMVIVNNGKGSINIIRHSKNSADSNCQCNFGDDEDWIDDVVKDLKQENLITDACDYKFKLTPHSFSVNGKEITDQQTISKMIDMYESSSGNRLRKDDDYILVKVTKSSCDLSKNINDK